MVEPERGVWERSNFKEVPQFLISNRISPAYGLTGNKDQSFINKSCFVFFLYRRILRFCAIFGRFGGMTPFDPFRSAFEGHGSPPPVNMVYSEIWGTPPMFLPIAKKGKEKSPPNFAVPFLHQFPPGFHIPVTYTYIHTCIYTYIHAYMHDPSLFSIDWWAPASRLRRPFSV